MSNEVDTNLQHFIDTLDKDIIKQGMLNACAMVANTAKEKCPKDTGALRRSIDFQVSEEGTEGIIYSNMEYAPYVEIGTGIYSTQGNGRKTPWRYKTYNGWFTTKGNPAQPFLKPALETNKSNIVDCFKGLV